MVLGRPGTVVGAVTVEQGDVDPDHGSPPPQHFVTPVVSTAQVVDQPTETDSTRETESFGGKATGAVEKSVTAGPSVPQPAFPQHQNDPSAFTTHTESP